MHRSDQRNIYRLLLVVDDNLAIHEDIRKILAPDPDQAALETMEAALFGDAAA